MSTYYSPKISTDGLVMYLDAFNRSCFPGSGATVADLSGVVGDFSGTSTYANSSTGFVSGASWTSGTTSILNTDVHSIFFKIRFSSNSTYPNGTSGNWNKIFTYAPSGTDRSPGIWRWPDNRWIHWRYDPVNSGCDFGKNGTSLDTGNQFDIGVWYYVGVTKNGGNTVMYVNGVRIGTGSVSNPKTSGNAAIILMENYPNPICNIDQIAIYNRVLSDAEVLNNFDLIKRRTGWNTVLTAYGTLLNSYCSGCNLVGVYADGQGGSYINIIEYYYPSCGCQPP